MTRQVPPASREPVGQEAGSADEHAAIQTNSRVSDARLTSSRADHEVGAARNISRVSPHRRSGNLGTMAQDLRFTRRLPPSAAEKDLVKLRWDQAAVRRTEETRFAPPPLKLAPAPSLVSAPLVAHAKPLQQPLPPGTKMTLNPAQISLGVERVASMLDREYASRAPEVVLLGILNGAMPFLSDLSRSISFSPVLETLRTSSYDGSGNHSAGLSIEGLDRLKKIVAGKEVVLVEDLVDTGRTTTLVAEALIAAGAKDVRTAALLSKPSKLEAGYRAPEFVGYVLSGDPWLLGYGMDGEGGKYRTLPYVAELIV